MNRLFQLSACAALVLAGPAHAEQVRFRGTLTLTAAQNCMARYVGETFNSAFRPANLGDNGTITSLTTLNQYSGDVYELPGKQFTLKQTEIVNAWGLDNLHYSFPARIMLSVQIPSTITAATTNVFLIGVVQNFGADPGAGGTCVVSFRASYIRRVE